MLRRLLMFLTMILIFASGAYAQSCADVNGDNHVDISDMVYMFAEHMGGVSIPAGKGDIDYRQGYNAGDLRFLIDYLFEGGPTPGCPPFPPYSLIKTNDSLILPSCVIPAGSGQFALPITLINHARVRDIVLPMRVNGLSSTIFFDSLQMAGLSTSPLLIESALSSTGVFAISSLFPSQDILPGANLLARAFFHYTSSPGGTISLDTVTIRPHTFLNYVYYTGYPEPGLAIGIPKVVVAAFPEMIVEPDTLFFETLVGSPDPAPQQFSIQSIGNLFNWTLTKPSWIGVDPTSGVSGQNVSVTPNTTGLSIGVYYGDIIVSSTEAPNSPQKVVVRLRVKPPFFVPLDANCDGVLNLADIVTEVHYMLGGGSLCNPCTGEWPTIKPQFVPLDANCDGVLNLADIMAVIKYMFRGGSVCDPCTGEWP